MFDALLRMQLGPIVERLAELGNVLLVRQPVFGRLLEGPRLRALAGLGFLLQSALYLPLHHLARRYQRSLGLPADGYPTIDLLERLLQP